MNLCRSGVAACFNDGEDSPIPAATEYIANSGLHIVTLNEMCSAELDAMVAELNEGIGPDYLASWQPVGHNGGPYPCNDGRGDYGIAVLAKQGSNGVGEKESQYSGYYDAQDGPAEQRAYLCVTFVKMNACTAHLSIKDSVNAQCAQLKGMLAEHGSRRETVFGGDLNLFYPGGGGKPSAQECVPEGLFRKGDPRSNILWPAIRSRPWTRTSERYRELTIPRGVFRSMPDDAVGG